MTILWQLTSNVFFFYVQNHLTDELISLKTIISVNVCRNVNQFFEMYPFCRLVDKAELLYVNL